MANLAGIARGSVREPASASRSLPAAASAAHTPCAWVSGCSSRLGTDAGSPRESQDVARRPRTHLRRTSATLFSCGEHAAGGRQEPGLFVKASFEVGHEVAGWTLAWSSLALRPSGAEVAEAAAEARAAAARRSRERFAGESLTADPVASAVRRLFRAAGTDPTRYRPSSEALLRHVLRGEVLPAIRPLVDLNNGLSVALAARSCVMAAGSIGGRIRLRRGRPGERLCSLRGDFDLAGKVRLEAERGPFG